MTPSRSRMLALLAAGVVAIGAAYLLIAPPHRAAPEPVAPERPSLVQGRRLRAVPAPDDALPGEGEQSPKPEALQFCDATEQTGITFVHTNGSSGRKYVMETMAGGLATLDYDGDGRIDIYFPNGAPLPGATYARPPRHALWKNQGDWRFLEVTEAAGVAATAFGMGLAVADCDHDGFPDLYLSNFGPNVLYHNNGDGTFADVTPAAGVDRGARVGAGVCFLDLEGDGWLDLFVANYVQFSYASHRPHEINGVPFYPGPLDYAAEMNVLFRNLGDGTFRDVSGPSGLSVQAGTAMGVIAGDFDGDGDTDVFVANDGVPNFLFRNDGRGNFEQAGVASGVAYDAVGVPHASMGVEAGDYDNDGLLDLDVTSYQNEWTTLFRNLGDGFFLDVTRPTNAGNGTFPHVTWGAGLVDFDNDGDRDLFIVCGHTEDNIHQRDPHAAYRARPILLKNLLRETGQARFVNVSDRCGDGLRVVGAGRGACFDDLDNDGDIDVVILNSRAHPTVLRNMLQENRGRNHWLQVCLQGTQTNRDGVGARVRVLAGDLSQVDEVHSGRGYQSHFGSRLHFGLGGHDRVERLEVRWLGGGVQVLENVAVDRRITIMEEAGSGESRTGPSQASKRPQRS